ncbi:methyltransferase family protein [Mucilaginibacter frigoritolerans]|jgi:SAM-dependent methyltransferase|uniref:Methyltransferase family protein n=1 Tax=Mucilaginibacter frigoritolerans TaxID=652788 RepID=A0A562TX48_9SPHI|nr:class I SAM-dependent methyltransferase [Mucilaginibacter frigoritolerans]TWI97686.1 methyltransferase family protein [Mucilaginibacter frigoritolerans]
MKIRTPKTMDDLLIKKRYNVLEVGGGNHPDKRAHVVVDKYVEDNTHRSGNLRVLKNQKFLQADGEHLPFKDQEFDYVICRHVLEHVDDPIQFVKEQARVAKRGYMETPSLLGEYIAPKESHRWLIQDIDNKLVLYDKEVVGFKPWMDFGEAFLYYLPKTSIAFKILERTQAPIITVNYEWEDEIEILINPQDEYYLNHFIKPWDESMCEKMISKRSFGKEVTTTIGAMFDIMVSVTRNKLLGSDS